MKNVHRANWVRKCVAILALAAMGLGSSACSKKTAESPATEPAPGAVAQGTEGEGKGGEAKGFVAGTKTDMFTFVLDADPQTLDPSRMSGSPEGRVAFNIFEGLLMPGPTTEGLQNPLDGIVPGVAEKYEVSEDGRTYTFHLRANAKWSNGDDLTSEDFAKSWKRILTPDFPGDYVQMLWVIQGAQAFSEGKSTDWGTVGVKTPDPKTLVVELVDPTPYFPELLAFYTFFPVHIPTVEKHGEAWTRPENIVSNGPYKMTSYRPQQEIMLEASEHYWDKPSLRITKARMRIIPDNNAVVNAYRTGELHWTGTSLPVAQIASLLTHEDYLQEPMLGTYFYRINVSKGGPMADVRVRQALALAVDRETLVNETMNGLYEKAESFVPPSMPGYKATTRTAYNVQKAKQLLAEAGFNETNKLPKITVLYNTDENHKLIAESLQDMWKRNLGVEVELINKEWKTYLQDTTALNYEMARAGWIGDYNDPMTFLDMWETQNGNNNTGWSDAEYDGLIQGARKEVDKAKRMQMLQKAEEILLERGPIIPIYYYSNNILVSRFLEGFKPNNRDNHLLKYMHLPGLEK